ncbi:hypothetical protein ACFLZ8_02630 [Planctomycetota bacterium]
MKDKLKNPMIYYIAVPMAIALWPLLLWGKYLPDAQSEVTSIMDDYKTAEALMTEILTLDPQRLNASVADVNRPEFTYGSAIDKVANLCNIIPDNFNTSTGKMIGSGEQKSQTANIDLKAVEIAQFARFLSTIQQQWPALICERVSLTKKPEFPDTWDADINFKYIY